MSFKFTKPELVARRQLLRRAAQAQRKAQRIFDQMDKLIADLDDVKIELERVQDADESYEGVLLDTQWNLITEEIDELDYTLDHLEDTVQDARSDRLIKAQAKEAKR